MSSKRPEAIALDADGVLLDYSAAYRQAWKKAYGVLPALKNDKAYWPWGRWDVPRLTHQELQPLREAMDEHFWLSIPAIDGAVEACAELRQFGYQLVCVTALNPKWREARHANLEMLGFGISQVVVADNTRRIANPKAEIINEMRPAAFVDDYLPYMLGISGDVNKALIDRDPWGSPNVGDVLSYVNSKHESLKHFVQAWTSALGGTAG